MTNKAICLIKILEYLYSNTDDNHDTTAEEIRKHFEKQGITIGHRTIDLYIKSLQECGFDIIRYLGTQYRYHIGERLFDTAEVKLLIDAVQTAKFITLKQSKQITKKLSGLISKFEAHKLNRHLYIEKTIKPNNKSALRTIDLINSSINDQKAICFQYCYYDPEKNKCLKHNGLVYRFCPYDLIWINDAYYVLGYSYENHHQKIVKFRIDRMYNAEECNVKYIRRPTGYSVEKYFSKVFSMYDGPLCKVKLICHNKMMNAIIDRFGIDVNTQVYDKEHFIVETEVCASPTFFSWIFTFAGQIKIVSPNDIKEEYNKRLKTAYC